MNIHKDATGREYDLVHEENGICWFLPMKRGFKLVAAVERALRGLDYSVHDNGLPTPVPRVLLAKHFVRMAHGEDEYAKTMVQIGAKLPGVKK